VGRFVWPKCVGEPLGFVFREIADVWIAWNHEGQAPFPTFAFDHEMKVKVTASGAVRVIPTAIYKGRQSGDVSFTPLW